MKEKKSGLLYFVVILTVLLLSLFIEEICAECETPLLQYVLPELVTATSVRQRTVAGRQEDFSPNQARLNTSFDHQTPGIARAGAWSPAVNDLKQWIQVEFPSVTLIKGIVIRGRALEPSGCCAEWVNQFKLAYSVDGRSWTVYSENQAQDSLLTGNTNNDAIVRNRFGCPVTLKAMRIMPVAWNQHIALRFDVLGCPMSLALCASRCSACGVSDTTLVSLTPTGSLEEILITHPRIPPYIPGPLPPFNVSHRMAPIPAFPNGPIPATLPESVLPNPNIQTFPSRYPLPDLPAGTGILPEQPQITGPITSFIPDAVVQSPLEPALVVIDPVYAGPNFLPPHVEPQTTSQPMHHLSPFLPESILQAPVNPPPKPVTDYVFVAPVYKQPQIEVPLRQPFDIIPPNEYVAPVIMPPSRNIAAPVIIPPNAYVAPVIMPPSRNIPAPVIIPPNEYVAPPNTGAPIPPPLDPIPFFPPLPQGPPPRQQVPQPPVVVRQPPGMGPIPVGTIVYDAAPAGKPVCVDRCTGVIDGDYQSCGVCQGYVSCSNGRIHNRPCPGALVWDDSTKRCEWASTTCVINRPRPIPGTGV